jgi:hypothetical protein
MPSCRLSEGRQSGGIPCQHDDVPQGGRSQARKPGPAAGSLAGSHARPRCDPGSVLIEKEIRKGDAGHPIGTARADLLRKDIWDRWRAGARLPPFREPLTDAIGKLADVADRQLALLQRAATVQQPVTIHRPVSEQVDRPIVQARRDPPAALVEQPDRAIAAVQPD